MTYFIKVLQSFVDTRKFVSNFLFTFLKRNYNFLSTKVRAPGIVLLTKYTVHSFIMPHGTSFSC